MRGVLILTIATGVIAGFGLGLVWLDWGRTGHQAPLPMRTVTLAFQARSAATRLLGKGWSAPESWGVWTIGPRAELAVPIREKVEGDVSIGIEARAYITPPRFDHQTVIVDVNGNEVAKLSYGRTDSRHATRLFAVPKGVAKRNNPMRIAFRILTARSPADVGVSKDTRKLGIGLQELTLTFPSPEVYLE